MKTLNPSPPASQKFAAAPLLQSPMSILLMAPTQSYHLVVLPWPCHYFTLVLATPLVLPQLLSCSALVTPTLPLPLLQSLFWLGLLSCPCSARHWWRSCPRLCKKKTMTLPDLSPTLALPHPCKIYPGQAPVLQQLWPQKDMCSEQTHAWLHTGM